MKRTRSRRNRNPGSNRGEEGISTTNTDLDEQSDATYETDLIEPDIPHENVSDRTRTLPWSQISGGAGELYEDPLDEGGVDVSEIPTPKIKRAMIH